MVKIDVIIPLYKPGKELFTLLQRLERQTVTINRIILMNTEEKYFEELVYGSPFQEKYAGLVSVYHLSKREFDHGRTRHQAVQKSDADIFVMMTQDALPADTRLLEELLLALQEEKTAVAYARQLPAEDCNVIERHTRSFNYPDESCVKTEADVSRLGIKTYFCSNVCAAYKRSVYDELGGFIRHTIFNEDMIFAAKAVKEGYGVAYVAEAKVIHSHNYTNIQQFKRNFDLGVSQADHPEVFAGVPSEKEGKKMVAETTGWLWKTKKWFLLPHFYMQCACRYAGYFLGKHYRHLPRFLIEKFTSNRQYWQ
ncbi:MAG: glycosyltransferase family 2 protein [Lachnospiraceae bacterium]